MMIMLYFIIGFTVFNFSFLSLLLSYEFMLWKDNAPDGKFKEGLILIFMFTIGTVFGSLAAYNEYHKIDVSSYCEETLQPHEPASVIKRRHYSEITDNVYRCKLDFLDTNYVEKRSTSLVTYNEQIKQFNIITGKK